MRSMARAVQHPTRSAGPPQTRKRSIFPRAFRDCGKRSRIESERNSPNARVRTMRTSATTDVSRVRARARACAADGTRLGLRPNQPFELQTPRPTGAGVDAKPNSQCVASYVPVFAAGSAVPLTVSRNALCSRPTRCRPITPADRAQCDAHIMPRVCRRTPKSAACAVLRAWHWLGVAARRLKEERVDDAGGRTSATAASYAASSSYCSAHWRGVRLRRFGPIRRAARRRGNGRHSVTRHRS